ncbi:ABC transporter permease [Nocardioides sp. CCNWLW239]|uniref:ABC transporter permease n=1 Tax=Nocardioides sp. CCNWLW239 TaxID=3128902 RepID=UPI003016197A
MFGYIVRRLLAACLVLFLVSIVTFTLFFKGPSDPASVLCEDTGGRCTAAELNSIREQMGLNDGLVVNYGRFLKGLVVDREMFYQGEQLCEAPCFGISYATRQPVTPMFIEKWPATVSLVIGAFVLYVIVGLVLGALAARFRGSLFDRMVVGVATFIPAIPYYVLALVAWIVLVLQLSVFPETGYTPLVENPVAWASGLLLPWLILALAYAPVTIRYMRGYMIEALGEDYIRTATAKGVSRRDVVFVHGLRAAIVPMTTILGLDIAILLSGTVFTEFLFEIDGIGWWSINSLGNPIDFPVLNITGTAAAVLIVVGNLLVDLLYAALDPRVRLA